MRMYNGYNRNSGTKQTNQGFDKKFSSFFNMTPKQFDSFFNLDNVYPLGLYLNGLSSKDQNALAQMTEAEYEDFLNLISNKKMNVYSLHDILQDIEKKKVFTENLNKFKKYEDTINKSFNDQNKDVCKNLKNDESNNCSDTKTSQKEMNQKTVQPKSTKAALFELTTAADGSTIISVEMPGVDKTNVKITVVNGTLTATGTCKTENGKERVYVFLHSLTSKNDKDAIKANMNCGILRIEIPKTSLENLEKIVSIE